MSIGLAVFDALCVAGNTIAAMRELCDPGSNAWIALTELLFSVDAIIDHLIDAHPIDDEDDKVA